MNRLYTLQYEEHGGAVTLDTEAFADIMKGIRTTIQGTFSHSKTSLNWSFGDRSSESHL